MDLAWKNPQEWTFWLEYSLSCHSPGSVIILCPCACCSVFWNAMVASLAWNVFLMLPNTLNGDDACYISNTDTGETAEAFTTVIWNRGLLRWKNKLKILTLQLFWKNMSLNFWCKHKHKGSFGDIRQTEAWVKIVEDSWGWRLEMVRNSSYPVCLTESNSSFQKCRLWDKSFCLRKYIKV